jgi:hypothetical protein
MAENGVNAHYEQQDQDIVSLDTLKTFSKIEKIETHTVFTTHRKKPKTTINISRKGSVVKERCKQLTQIIADLCPNRVISEEDLVCLIEDYIGADKETVRNYKGYSGHIRAGRCGDNHIVGLSRKGYLEQFGFLKKLPQRRWMICQTVLSSQDMTSDSLCSNEKISISQLLSGSSAVSANREAKENIATVTELEEEEDTEKERFFTPKIIGEQPQLTPLEMAILVAKPCEEKDKSKVAWGEQAPVVPPVEDGAEE